MADPCLHEKDWGRVIEMIEAQHKEIYGNGKPGLTHEVTGLSVKMEMMNQSVKDLSTNISALMKFENQFTSADNTKKYTLEKYLKIAGFLLALFIAYQAWDKRMNRLETQVNWINTPMQNSRGETILYPSGMLVDSIVKDSSWKSR